MASKMVCASACKVSSMDPLLASSRVFATWVIVPLMPKRGCSMPTETFSSWRGTYGIWSPRVTLPKIGSSDWKLWRNSVSVSVSVSVCV